MRISKPWKDQPQLAWTLSLVKETTDSAAVPSYISVALIHYRKQCHEQKQILFKTLKCLPYRISRGMDLFSVKDCSGPPHKVIKSLPFCDRNPRVETPLPVSGYRTISLSILVTSLLLCLFWFAARNPWLTIDLLSVDCCEPVRRVIHSISSWGQWFL